MSALYAKVAPCTACAALLLLLSSWTATAQDAATQGEEAPKPEKVEVPETYLDPLKALDNDEDAFVDKVWEMGDHEFAKIAELRRQISSGELQPDEIGPAQREIYQRVLQLKTLAEYAVQRRGHNARIRNFHGNVLYDALGEQEGGVKEWHTAVSLDSKYPNPYNNLGMHYFHVGRYDLGFKNMDTALDLDPKNPDFCFNMAQNYLIFRPQTEAHRGWSAKKVYKEAMKLSKKATKLAPDDYELLEDYAVNFLAAQNFGVDANWKDAIKAWQAAREHAPTSADLFFTWLNEGRVWRTLEKKDEALRCFREALKVRPSSELTERLIQELETES